MTTVRAPNVGNVAVEGTFDDCQDLVKAMFADAPFRAGDASFRRQLDQLGAGRGADSLLRRGGAGAGRAGPGGRVRRPDRQFRQRARGLGGAAHGPAGRAADRRLQPQRHPGAVPGRQRHVGRGRSSRACRPAWTSRSAPISSACCSSWSERDPEATARTMRRFRETGRMRVPGRRLAARARELFHGFRLDDAGHRGGDPRGCTARPAISRTRTAPSASPRRARYPCAHGVPTVAMATAHPAKFPDAIERATGLRPALPRPARGSARARGAVTVRRERSRGGRGVRARDGAAEHGAERPPSGAYPSRAAASGSISGQLCSYGGHPPRAGPAIASTVDGKRARDGASFRGSRRQGVRASGPQQTGGRQPRRSQNVCTRNIRHRERRRMIDDGEHHGRRLTARRRRPTVVAEMERASVLPRSRKAWATHTLSLSARRETVLLDIARRLCSCLRSCPPRSPHRAFLARFAAAIDLLCRGVATSLPQNWDAAPLALPAWTRLRRLLVRFAALVAALEAGRFSAAAPDAGASPRPRSGAPAIRLPGWSGWLLWLAPALETRIGRAHVESLLGDPELGRCSCGRRRRDASCARCATCYGSKPRRRCGGRAVPVPARPDLSEGHGCRGERACDRLPRGQARRQCRRALHPARLAPVDDAGRHTRRPHSPIPRRTGPPGN